MATPKRTSSLVARRGGGNFIRKRSVSGRMYDPSQSSAPKWERDAVDRDIRAFFNRIAERGERLKARRKEKK